VLEPVAAAMEYEGSLDRNRVTMVLDAGGGTTDVTMMQLGPSYRRKVDREPHVLGVAGDRVGGNDLDIKLAWRCIMPLLGKDSTSMDGLPIPSPVLWDAVSTNDIPAQKRFYASDLHHIRRGAAEPDKLERLVTLQQKTLTYRLSRSAELAKIHLSSAETGTLPLGYLDPELSVPFSRVEFADAIERELKIFERLVNDVQVQAGTRPEVVYVTGGTANSPVIHEWLSRLVGSEADIVTGDLFAGVTSGLARIAHSRYG